MSVRLIGRFLVYFLAAYGPLAPITFLFLVAMPVLVALSGWTWSIDLTFALAETALIVGAVIWLGPDAYAATREFLDEERRT